MSEDDGQGWGISDEVREALDLGMWDLELLTDKTKRVIAALDRLAES